jgi:hypothetical protein
VRRREDSSKTQCAIHTRGLRAFLLEAGVDATVTAHVIATIDEYVGRPESGARNCFLVKPEALALSEECIADYHLDIIGVLGGEDW